MLLLQRISTYDAGLILCCAGFWLWSAAGPYDFGTWLLEQVAAILALAALFWSARRASFSPLAKLGIALLVCLHCIGTHYTYSLTPYDRLFDNLLDLPLNAITGWERNHYDRFVHFMYGLCLALPARQLLVQHHRLAWLEAEFMGAQLILASSAFYELVEWAAAVLLGDGSQAFLGMQGDPWDAQADMALAMAGWAVVSTGAFLRRFGSFSPDAPRP